MSEYQYYRFECLDGRLNNEQRQALRQISSRAEISAASFQVYYHYSGLKAEPYKVMLDYFDIGFFYADWGSIGVYIKLPIGTIPDALLNFKKHGFDVRETQEWQLLVFSIEEYYEYCDYFDDEAANNFFQHLAILRSELMRGDWRLLYFMWLRELDKNNDKLAAIPMINFDFDQLSDAQSAFIDLFDIPLALVKALTQTLATNPNHQPTQSQFHIDDWLSQLTEREKNMLLKVVFEQGQLTRHQALTMTRKAQVDGHKTYQHWLTLETIEPYIEQAEIQFKQEQAEALAQKQAIEKKEKEAKLSEIYTSQVRLWQQAQDQADRTCSSGYDRASSYLHQLAEAYQFKGEVVEFERRFKQFIASNNNRKALLSRLQDLL